MFTLTVIIGQYYSVSWLIDGWNRLAVYVNNMIRERALTVVDWRMNGGSDGSGDCGCDDGV